MSNTFKIVADVEFVIPLPIRGAFNAHHKTNLVKTSPTMGKVTPEGVRHFTNRPRQEFAQMIAQIQAEGYSIQDGQTWPFKNGVKYPLGLGLTSQSLFAWALSTLTQAAEAKANAAARAAKLNEAAKAARAAKAKAKQQVQEVKA